jgi:flagellar hook protein FlgE
MMRGMYSAISGLETSQTMLDVTANNLANIDTIGYKAQRITFVDQLAQTVNPASGPNSYNGGSNAQQIGLGVQVGSIDNIMGQGSAESTGNPLDLCVQGDGFFQVDTGDPSAAPTASTLQYTRAGNFTLNSAGYLTTQSGQYVVGTATSGGTTQQFINVPPGSTDVAVGQNGAVTYVPASGGDPVTAGYLQLASFPNEAGLTRDGGSMWSASASSGAPSLGSPGTGNFGQTISGELEMSNVDLATEFTNMITAERSYEANSKVITTADEMLQTVVNMPQG